MARQGIGAIVGRVMALATVYDSLLGVGLSHTIDLGSYLGELCASLPALQDKRALPIDLVYTQDTILLGLDSVTALGMAVAELVTNSYGHAFPGRGGTITVALAGAPQGNVANLTISDDGIGFVTAPDSVRHGLSLVNRLMTQVGGSSNLQCSDGTCWTLTFPVPPLPQSLRAAA